MKFCISLYLLLEIGHLASGADVVDACDDEENAFYLKYIRVDRIQEESLLQFNCSINKNAAIDCQTALDSAEILNSTQLKIINGSIIDADSSMVDINEVEMKIFIIKLDYELHNNRGFSCISTEKEFVSNTVKIPDIIEKNYVNLTATVSKFITAGGDYELNCTTENNRGLAKLDFYVSINGNIESKVFCDESRSLQCERVEVTETKSLILKVRTDSAVKEKESYIFHCTARGNSFHTDEDISDKIEIVVLPINKTWITIVSSVVGIVVLISGVVIISVVVKKRRVEKAVKMSMQMADVREIDNLSPTNNYRIEAADHPLMAKVEKINEIMERISHKHANWIKNKQQLKIKKQIGVGNFGAVFSGSLPNENGIIEKVAIKTIKEDSTDVAALLDFEKEIDMMTLIHHSKIVNLIGICTTSLPFYIITELMENGQLNNYLISHAPTKQNPLGGISVPDLGWICQQPCDALCYLASKSLVHRDVSARNCLVGSNNLVKLADFGLSRDTSDNEKNYYKKSGGVVPVKWTAPEALTYGKYTTYNDVWAFGVLCWEVFSFGAQPYAHLSNRDVMSRINQGERLERPQLCPEPLWALIKQCWTDSPDDRITFPDLLASFITFLEDLHTDIN